MYGLVNKGLEDLICKDHGEAAWQRIKNRAGVDTDGFLSMDVYPDQMTYGLVGAASEELGIPAEQLLRAFGRHWIVFTGRTGYAALFDLFAPNGAGLREFLKNLDNLHTRVGLSFPQLMPPSFRCLDEAGGRSTRLQYLSKRPGLAPMVEGLLEGLSDLFHTPIRIARIPAEESAEGCVEFLVEFEPA